MSKARSEHPNALDWLEHEGFSIPLKADFRRLTLDELAEIHAHNLTHATKAGLLGRMERCLRGAVGPAEDAEDADRKVAISLSILALICLATADYHGVLPRWFSRSDRPGPAEGPQEAPR